MIRTLDRAIIFSEYPTIRELTRGFQESFYDAEDDNPEVFDTMSYEAGQVDREFFIAGFSHEDINTYPQVLAEKLTSLWKLTDSDQVILMPFIKTDLFSTRENDHPLLAKAYNELEKLMGCDTLDEAIVADISHFPDLVSIFFWLVRCDPGLPEYILWFDCKERFCFSLCQYGNLHVVHLSKARDVLKNI